MSADPNQVRQAIQNAREALRQGDLAAARRWAEQAARLAPETEEPWLLLTAVSEPRAALEHAKRALVINPESSRARKAVDWARSRVVPDEAPARVEDPIQALRRSASPSAPFAQGIPLSAPKRKETSPPPPAFSKPKPRRSLAYPILLVGFACVAIAIAGYFSAPAVASMMSADAKPVFTATSEGPRFVQAELDKPTFTPEWTATPEWTFTPSLTPTDVPTLTPTFTFTPTVTLTPEFTFTPTITDTPLPTETPGIAEVVIVPDTPTSVAPPTRAYVAPSQVAAPSGGGYGARWIDVNLSQQMVYAYEGDVVVNSFLASTGVWQTPTVTGTYKIYVKYRFTDMSGPGYYLPDVPYVMYFYEGYGIHGTYWHNNFGTPMSRGCVNLSVPDAGWVFNWASVGTVVKVHY